MEITNSNDWTAMRSRLAAPIAVPSCAAAGTTVPSCAAAGTTVPSHFATGLAPSFKGGLRPQAAVDATFLGSQTWSPLIT